MEGILADFLFREMLLFTGYFEDHGSNPQNFNAICDRGYNYSKTLGSQCSRGMAS